MFSEILILWGNLKRYATWNWGWVGLDYHKQKFTMYLTAVITAKLNLSDDNKCNLIMI